MTDPLAEKIGVNVQGGTVNVQNLNIGIAERLAESGDRVRILVVAANPLGSSPLKLDHEVKTIQEALRRSRKRDNFVVEYRLAATPSELRRALLDVEPHVLHFSGHGAGEQGLLFVSDESAGAIYRSDSGEVRSRSTNSNEIKFVPAQPLANLLQLCDGHLECVVLNACYSDVQGDAISANIPFTIGMRDVVEDNVAIKFSQGFYDAIGAGKGYENAFKWGKVAIEFDLAGDEAAKILVLRKNEKITITSPQSQDNPSIKQSALSPINRKRRGLGEKDNEPNKEREKSEKPEIKENSYDITGDVAKKGRRNNLPKTVAFAIGVSLTAGGGCVFFITSLGQFPPPPPLSSVDISRDYFKKGKEQYKLGNIEKAIAYYNKAIENDSTPSEFYFNRGNARYDRNDKKGATEDYQQVIKRNPNDAEAYYRMGVSMSELGDYKGAIDAFNQAIKIRADDPNIYTFRGNAKYNLGQEEEAIKDYEIAINIDPNFAPAYSKLGLAKYTLGQKDVAISQYTKAISLQPSFAEPYVGRGDVQRSLRNFKEAISDYNMAIRLKPDYADAFVSRGLAHYDLGDKKQALLDYDKAIEVNLNWGITKLVAAYINRGITKSDLGDKQGAIIDFNEAIRLTPMNPNPYFYRGLAKKSSNDNEGAIQDLNESIRLKPDSGSSYYQRGLIHKDIGNRQQALADFRKASELYQQQGNTEWYNNSRDRIRELGG